MVSVDEEERGAHKLGNNDANTTAVKPCQDEKSADDLHSNALIPSRLMLVLLHLLFQHPIGLWREFHTALWAPVSQLSGWHGEDMAGSSLGRTG
jgi:hypothetical protein